MWLFMDIWLSSDQPEYTRLLFNNSRTRKASANDADRLRKYLARFELTWDRITQAEETSE